MRELKQALLREMAAHLLPDRPDRLEPPQEDGSLPFTHTATTSSSSSSSASSAANSSRSSSSGSQSAGVQSGAPTASPSSGSLSLGSDGEAGSSPASAAAGFAGVAAAAAAGGGSFSSSPPQGVGSAGDGGGGESSGTATSTPRAGAAAAAAAGIGAWSPASAAGWPRRLPRAPPPPPRCLALKTLHFKVNALDVRVPRSRGRRRPEGACPGACPTAWTQSMRLDELSDMRLLWQLPFLHVLLSTLGGTGALLPPPPPSPLSSSASSRRRHGGSPSGSSTSSGGGGRSRQAPSQASTEVPSQGSPGQTSSPRHHGTQAVDAAWPQTASGAAPPPPPPPPQLGTLALGWLSEAQAAADDLERVSPEPPCFSCSLLLV